MTFSFNKNPKGSASQDARTRRVLSNLAAGSGSSTLKAELFDQQYVEIIAGDTTISDMLNMMDFGGNPIILCGQQNAAGVHVRDKAGYFVVYDADSYANFYVNQFGCSFRWIYLGPTAVSIQSLNYWRSIDSLLVGRDLALDSAQFSADELKAGHWFGFIDSAGVISSSTPFMITPGGTFTINGAASPYIMSDQYGAVWGIYDGANNWTVYKWFSTGGSFSSLHLDDNQKLTLGTGIDAEVFYDSADLVINPRAVGTGALVIGSGSAGVDYVLKFNGETNDGVITWMEDEDWFKFSDEILMDTTEGVMFRDANQYVASLNAGYLDLSAGTAIRLNKNVEIGSGAAGVDYTLTFNGQDSDGVITWMEDEDYFKFGDDVLIDSTEKVQFRDTAIYLYSQADGYLNVVADSGVRIGDATPTNYTQFDSTGHQTMVGTAKPWNDLLIEPVARTTGANAPTFEQYADDAGLGDTGSSRGIFLYSFDDAAAGSEKEVFFNMQMSHSWDLATLQLHVHWIGAVNDTTSAPRWGLEYSWKGVGETFGATTTIYTDGVNYTLTGTDADITAGKHYISEFAVLNAGATQNTVSSILIGRLFRNSSDAADTYNAAGAKCGLLYIDAHYQLNSLGSTDEYTK